MKISEAAESVKAIPKNRRAQRKIVKEILDVYNEATERDISHWANGNVSVTVEYTSVDCKSKKVSCYVVGIRGGLKIIKKEW